jgi:uncharacterized protein (TIGR00369 family)
MTHAIATETDLTFPAIEGLDMRAVRRASHTPMGKKIGLHYLAVGDARIGTGLLYDPQLVGNVNSGVLHGGVVTAMIDEASGGATVIATNAAQAVATVDMRVDYMRPAEPGRALYCLAHCYRTTRRIAFFRAEAFHTPDKPVAIGVGTFMLGANATKPSLLGNLMESI